MKPEEIIDAIKEFEERENMNEEEKKKFEVTLLILGIIFSRPYNDKKEDSLQ